MVIPDEFEPIGDPLCDAGLFRELYPRLRRFAAVVGARGDDPDDLVQEAVTRALSRGRLTELKYPEAYLRRAVSNLVINRVRSQRTRRPLELRVVGDVSRVDDYPSDLDALFQLRPRDRAVLFLVDVEGWSFAEAAEMVGSTPVAERLRASRARRRLRELLKEER